MMKALVTGATGFVGSHLVRALLERGNTEVYITVRLQTDFWRIADIRKSFAGIYIIDLSDRDAVFNLIHEIKPDAVYHVATYGGFPAQADPEITVGTNLTSLVHLLDASIIHHVKHFINTGSSSEYGIKSSPMSEEDVCYPLSLYGITKLAATQYCSIKGSSSANLTNICTLRLFSPYGDKEDPSRLYPSIVNSLENNSSPKLSRPNSVRDFIPVEQVVRVYLQILQTDYISGTIINVGSGKQQTIAEFHRSIAAKLGKSGIEPIWGEAPQRANEPVMWQADITKLRSLIDLDERGSF